MQQLDRVIVADDATTSGCGECLCRDDLPVVIGIVVSVASDLLTCNVTSVNNGGWL